MDKQVELEYKMMLTRSQFNRMQKILSFGYPLKQVNHYYDTENFSLRKKRYALRIREVNNECILTLKTPNKVGVMEYECKVNSFDFEKIDLPSELKQLLEEVTPIDTLRKYGELTTYRSINENEFATICLDENYYHNQHDYEIEYEVKKDHDSLNTFKELLSRIHIQSYRPAQGKALRVKRSLKLLNK